MSSMPLSLGKSLARATSITLAICGDRASPNVASPYRRAYCIIFLHPVTGLWGGVTISVLLGRKLVETAAQRREVTCPRAHSMRIGYSTLDV